MSFLSATIFPIGSEILYTSMLALDFNKTAILFVASVGNWLGGMFTYYMGYIGNEKIAFKYFSINKNKFDKISKKVEKFGSLLAFFTWLPIVGDIIALALGILKIKIFNVSIFMFIGKFLRYLLIIFLFLKGKELFL